MNINVFTIPVIGFFLIATTACNYTSVINNEAYSSDSNEILYVYEDGKMKLGSRYLNEEDVVIYNDGRGGEKAGVKVYMPLHSDFYRDSITVVRIQNNYDESITQSEVDKAENLN